MENLICRIYIDSPILQQINQQLIFHVKTGPVALRLRHGFSGAGKESNINLTLYAYE